MQAFIELLSPLPLAECMRRLRAEVGSGWPSLGSKEVIGRTDQNWLRIRKRIFYRNSFQTNLTATLSQDGDQTRIVCRIGMEPAVRVFMTVWFGGVLLIAAVVMASSAWSILELGSFGYSHYRKYLFGLLAPPPMTVFGFLLVRFGQYLARNERDFLLTFLRTTLDASQDH